MIVNVNLLHVFCPTSLPSSITSPFCFTSLLAFLSFFDTKDKVVDKWIKAGVAAFLALKY